MVVVVVIVGFGGKAGKFFWWFAGQDWMGSFRERESLHGRERGKVTCGRRKL